MKNKGWLNETCALDDANILAVSAAILRPHLKVEHLKKRENLKRQFMRYCGMSALRDVYRSGTRHCPKRPPAFQLWFCLFLCQVLPDGHQHSTGAGLAIWTENKGRISEPKSPGCNIWTFSESCFLWFWLRLCFFFFFLPHSWILTCRLGSLAKNDPMNSEMEWNKKRGLTGLSIAKERVRARERGKKK